MAQAAHTERKWWAEWVGFFYDPYPVAPVADNPDGGVDEAVFHCLGAGCKLADGDIQVTVDDCIWRPGMGAKRLFVEEVPSECRKSEHGEDARVSEPLAQCCLWVEAF